MSKIPEGATHTYTDSSGTTYYRKKVGDEWFVCADGEWWVVPGPAVDRYELIQAKPEWSGEGLPPVGMVIEFMKLNAPPKENGEWTKGDVRYLSDCTIVIGGDRCEHVHHPRNLFYRPIRTPEQIASAEKGRAVSEMLCIVTGPKLKDRGVTAQLEALYDANFRKQVEK